MKLPNNKVDIDLRQGSVSVTIHMVHPTWISSLLFAIGFLFATLLVTGLVFYDLMEIMGQGVILFTAFWGYWIYRILKTAYWHRYGQEFYLLADLAFSFQRSYGIHSSALKSIQDVGYQIGFLESPKSHFPDSEKNGLLLFYTIDPITKIESVLYESALEISEKEFDSIYSYLMSIRGQNENPILPIFLN